MYIYIRELTHIKINDMSNSDILKEKSSLTRKMVKAMKNNNRELAKSCVLSIEVLDAKLSFNLNFS